MIRNRQIRLLLVLAFMSALTLVVVLTSHKSTISKSKGTFAVADTASVTAVHISSTQNSEVMLQRIGHQWFVDGKMLARPDLAAVLLKAVHDIDKSKVVSKSDVKRIISQMSENGYDVEIFKGRKVAVAYTLLFSDDGECYARKSNANTVFVVETPGYSQIIAIFRLSNAIDWKSRAVFAVQPNAVAQIIFNDGTDNSFIIKKSGRGFDVFSYPLGLKVQNADAEKIIRFTEQFRHKGFSAYVQLQQSAIDSITATKPMYTLSVATTAGNEFWCKAFERRLPWNDNQLDPDNFYLLLNSGDFVQAKYFDFDPIVKSLEYFKD